LASEKFNRKFTGLINGRHSDARPARSCPFIVVGEREIVYLEIRGILLY
jgi:hypothetical protein